VAKKQPRAAAKAATTHGEESLLTPFPARPQVIRGRKRAINYDETSEADDRYITVFEI
jgi:hypothetical protein